MFTLETERLVIRPWTPADREAFTAMAQNPVIIRYVSGKPFTEQDIDEFFARQQRHLDQAGMCMGALVEKGSNRVVGVAGSQPMGKEIEIGWWLAQDVWGRGYATEAGRASRDFVLTSRPRVVAIIDPGNDRSVAVVTRLGFKHEGLFTGEQLGHRRPEIVVNLFAYEGSEGDVGADS